MTPLPFSAVKILSQFEAEDLARLEPKKWNIVSIWSGGGGKHGTTKPIYQRVKSLCQHRFHDINREEDGMILCNKSHIEEILNYVRKLYGEPVIFHCFGGISRSSGLALISFLDYYKDKSENPVDDALQLLIATKNSHLIYPNKYIIGLGMSYLAKDTEEEIKWNRDFYNHPITRRLYG